MWANSWLQHVLGVAVSVVLGAVVVGSTVATVVVNSPTHKQPVKQGPAVAATTKTNKAVKPKPTPAPVAAPAPAQAPPATAPAQAPASAAPTPVPASQPSPGQGVKQLIAADPPPASSPSPPPTNNGSTAPPATGGYLSTNWAGYVAISGSYTSVSGSWTVPSVTGNGSTTTADAAWIGVGGVFSGDLIQTGTFNTVSAGGQVSSFAFYELLPDAALVIPSVQVTAGDNISATVAETSPGQWQISITDNTTGQNFITSVSYASSHSSAEWIEEDPSYGNGSQVPFDNFSSVFFDNGSLVANGTTANIGGADSKPITLVDSNGNPLATPSILTNNGAGVSVTHN